MRRIIAILIGLLALSIGGCAAPRMVGMHTIARKQVPVMDGGKVVKVTAEGCVDQPQVTVRVESPLGTQETLDWYRRHSWLPDGCLKKKMRVGRRNTGA